MQLKSTIKYVLLVLFIGLAIIVIDQNRKSKFIKYLDEVFIQRNGASDVSNEVSKYIPIGMNVKDAIKFITDEGFSIVEFTASGYRQYPNGEIEQYSEDQKNMPREMNIPKNSKRVVYAAYLTYERMKIFTAKRLGISIGADDNKVVFVSAHIHITGF